MTPLDTIRMPRLLKVTAWTRLHFGWSAAWAGLWTVLCSVGYLLSHVVRPAPSVFSWWAGFWGKCMFFTSGIRVRVLGLERLPTDRPVVLLANHQNGIDIPAVAAGLPVSFGFVAKAELEHVPFLGWVLSNSPSVFVDRADPRRSLESIKHAGARIREGSSVLIFPEGQRSYDGRLGPFMKGAYLLAVESGVPIVPVTIVDAVSVLDESRKVSWPGTITIQVGEPISLDGLTRRDIPALMEQTHRAIARYLPQSWRNLPESAPVTSDTDSPSA